MSLLSSLYPQATFNDVKLACLAMKRTLLFNRAELDFFKTSGSITLVLSSRIITALALCACQNNNLSWHC